MEFNKANAMGNRLTKIEEIAPVYRFLCTEGAWTNGRYFPSRSLCSLVVFDVPWLVRLWVEYWTPTNNVGHEIHRIGTGALSVEEEVWIKTT